MNLFVIGKQSYDMVQIDTKTFTIVKDYSMLIVDEISCAVIDNNSEYLFLGETLGNFKIISIDTKMVVKNFTDLICVDEKSYQIKQRTLSDEFNESVYDFGTDDDKSDKSVLNGISIEAMCFCDNDSLMYLTNEKGLIFKYSFDHF